MANGIRTTNLERQFAIDELIGNISEDGVEKTARIPFEALLNQIAGTGAVVFGNTVYVLTKAQLDGYTPILPLAGGVVLNDPNPALNGYYVRSGGAWVKGRGFPDTAARLVSVAGSANAVTAQTQTGVNPGDVLFLFYTPRYRNTGAVTLSVNGGAARPLVAFDGEPLQADYLIAGATAPIYDDGTEYRLLFDHRWQALAQRAEDASESAETEADRSHAEANRSEAARDIAAGHASDAVSQGNVPIYATVVGMSAISVPVGINAVRVNGHTSVGDGGGSSYIKAVSEPAHDGKFQSDDGAWWELAPPCLLTVTPQMFGAVNAVVDAAPGVNKAIQFVNLKGGGEVSFPTRQYLAGSTFDLAGCSDITLRGQGWGARIVAMPSLNGSDSATKNNIIGALNFSGSVTSSDGYPHKNLTVRDLEIDGTLQNADEVPDDHFVGFSLAGFEVLNVDFVRVYNCKFVKCFGNGLVFGTQDPRQMNGAYQNGLRGCVAEDNWFEDVCRGLLPQYSSDTSPGGVTGSVMQAGSTFGVSIRNNHCIRPGGPLLDIFNAEGALVEGNIVDGFGYTPGGHSPLASRLYQQTVGTIRSDFGIKRSRIINNTCHGIILNGAMEESFFNGETPTPGPLQNTVKGNKVINPVGNTPITAPAIGSSGATYENTLTRPIYIFVIGGSGVVLERRRGTDGSFAPYTPGYLTSILLASGDAVKLTYSVAPTAWSWQIAPNAFSPGIQVTGGTVSGATGTVSGNIVEDNTVIAPGQQCFAGVDCFDNAVRNNHFEQPYFAGSGAALTFEKSLDQEGCGNQENEINTNTFVDTRSPKFMTSNVEFINGGGALRNLNNVIHDNRLENTTGTPIIANSGQDYIKNNHGPGRRLPALTSPPVAASAVELLNPFPYDCRVIVLGGTITQIAFGPPGATQVYGATGGLVHVRHREAIKITYSSPPTVFNWFPE